MFPCNGKIPLVKDFDTAATTDATIIKNWWDQWPKANPAIPMVPNKLVVLDVDLYKPGCPEAFAKLKEKVEFGLPTVKTGGGGDQYYYRCDDPNVKNSSGVLGPGIDIRGNGGYVVAPGAIHPDTGALYEWREQTKPTTLRKIPQGLLVSIYTKREASTGSEEPVPEGSRNAFLASLAGRLRRGGAALPVILAALNQANQDQCKPPLQDEEVQRTAESIARYAPEDVNIGKIVATYYKNEDKTQGRKVQITQASTVTSEKVTWLWYPWIPKKRITIFEGDPSVGKTFVQLTLAAMITRGWKLPGDPTEREPANVLYMTAEDGIADTILPRFIAAGGDPTRLFCLEGIKTHDPRFPIAPIMMSDVKEIDGAMGEVKPALLVIDPVQGFLGSRVDANRANEVRPILKGITDLSERYDCGTVIVRHLTKAKGNEQKNAMYRGHGSIDFIAMPRSGIRAERTDNGRVLVQFKSSLDREAAPLPYDIIYPDGRVEFYTADKFEERNTVTEGFSF